MVQEPSSFLLDKIIENGNGFVFNGGNKLGWVKVLEKELVPSSEEEFLLKIKSNNNYVCFALEEEVGNVNILSRSIYATKKDGEIKLIDPAQMLL